MFAPYGRRRLWALVVRHCPGCGYLHLHKMGNPGAASWRRTGSCGTQYLVVPA